MSKLLRNIITRFICTLTCCDIFTVRVYPSSGQCQLTNKQHVCLHTHNKTSLYAWQLNEINLYTEKNLNRSNLPYYSVKDSKTRKLYVQLSLKLLSYKMFLRNYFLFYAHLACFYLLVTVGPLVIFIMPFVLEHSNLSYHKIYWFLSFVKYEWVVLCNFHLELTLQEYSSLSDWLKCSSVSLKESITNYCRRMLMKLFINEGSLPLCYTND